MCVCVHMCVCDNLRVWQDSHRWRGSFEPPRGGCSSCIAFASSEDFFLMKRVKVGHYDEYKLQFAVLKLNYLIDSFTHQCWMKSCTTKSSSVSVTTAHPLVLALWMTSCTTQSSLVLVMAAHPLVLGEYAQPFGIGPIAPRVHQGTSSRRLWGLATGTNLLILIAPRMPSCAPLRRRGSPTRRTHIH